MRIRTLPGTCVQQVSVKQVNAFNCLFFNNLFLRTRNHIGRNQTLGTDANDLPDFIRGKP